VRSAASADGTPPRGGETTRYASPHFSSTACATVPRPRHEPASARLSPEPTRACQVRRRGYAAPADSPWRQRRPRSSHGSKAHRGCGGSRDAARDGPAPPSTTWRWAGCRVARRERHPRGRTITQNRMRERHRAVTPSMRLLVSGGKESPHDRTERMRRRHGRPPRRPRPEATPLGLETSSPQPTSRCIGRAAT
jgi:hypothetical protein